MCNNTLARTHVIVNNAFSHWTTVHFEGVKSRFKGSFDEQNLTLVVISYEMKAEGSFHKFHMK